jgi:hypothetical protein
MGSRVVVHALHANAEAVEHVAGRLRSCGVEIVDTQPHMLLVTGASEAVRRALGDARGWAVSEEVTVPRPRVRPNVDRKP